MLNTVPSTEESWLWQPNSKEDQISREFELIKDKSQHQSLRDLAEPLYQAMVNATSRPQSQEELRTFAVSGAIQAAIINDVLSTVTYAMQRFVDKYKGTCSPQLLKDWFYNYIIENRLHSFEDNRMPNVTLEGLDFGAIVSLLRGAAGNKKDGQLLTHWKQFFGGRKNVGVLAELRILRNQLSGHPRWKKSTNNFVSDGQICKLFNCAREVLVLVGKYITRSTWFWLLWYCSNGH